MNKNILKPINSSNYRYGQYYDPSIKITDMISQYYNPSFKITDMISQYYDPSIKITDMISQLLRSQYQNYIEGMYVLYR